MSVLIIMASTEMVRQTKKEIVHWINDNHATDIKIGKSSKLEPSACILANKVLVGGFSGPSGIIHGKTKLILMIPRRKC